MGLALDNGHVAADYAQSTLSPQTRRLLKSSARGWRGEAHTGWGLSRRRVLAPDENGDLRSQPLGTGCTTRTVDDIVAGEFDDVVEAEGPDDFAAASEDGDSDAKVKAGDVVKAEADCDSNGRQWR